MSCTRHNLILVWEVPYQIVYEMHVTLLLLTVPSPAAEDVSCSVEQ